MLFDDVKKLIDFATERRMSYRPCIVDLATRVGILQSYMIGIQWISDNYRLPNGARGLGRYMTDYSPDSNTMRVTVNKVTEYVIKARAATYPNDLSVDVVPSEAEYGIDSIAKSRVVESVANAAIDQSSLLTFAQMTNDARSVSGSHILGLYIQTKKRQMSGENGQVQEVADAEVKATCFEPYRLILDPANFSPNLRDHEDVGYYDVWEINKFRRAFGDMLADAGIIIDDDKLQTIGQLAPIEVEMGRLSRGQLYQDFQTYSKSKGLIVQQWHFKDPRGRFSQWYLMIDTEQTGLKCLNFDNPESPFGGDGLPFVHIRGHAKPRSPWGIGDVAMLRDKQDRLNLISSLTYRIIQKSAGHQWLVDLRAFPHAMDVDTIRNKFTNVVAGLVDYKPQSDRNTVNKPELVTTPPPQPIMLEMAEKIAEDDMQASVFRADINYGVGKSHVPHATNELLVREAGQVLGIRAAEDAQAYEQLIQVLTGTVIKLAQAGSPSVLGKLQQVGLGEQDFATISTVDPEYPACTISVRQGASRYRSPTEREAVMDNALTNQAVTPMQWRMAKATDVDAPLFNADRRMAKAIMDKVDTLVNGSPWVPAFLGEYAEYAMSLLREAALDRRVQQNPQLGQLVMQAIQTQMQMNMQEMAMSQPPQPEQDGLREGEQEPTLQSSSIGELLSGAA